MLLLWLQTANFFLRKGFGFGRCVFAFIIPCGNSRNGHITGFYWMLLKGGMGKGEWGMGNGEWGMGNGEWGMANGEWRIVVSGNTKK